MPKGLFSIFLIIALFSSSGCSSKRYTYGANGSTATSSALSVGGPGVTTRGVDGEKLLRIHRVGVAPLVFREQLPATLNSAELNKILLDEANLAGEIEYVMGSISSSPNSSKHGIVAFDSKVDSVLETEVVNIEERDGGRLGASSPAAVSIAMNLKDSSGVVLWSGEFSYHQEAIGSNFLKAGAALGAGLSPGWNSAKELFGKGISLLVQDLAERRRKEFVVTSAPKKDRASEPY